MSAAIPPFAALRQICIGKWVSSAVSAAAKIGVADRLESGPKTTQQLAQELQLNEMALHRLMRALTSVGIFHEGEGRLFSQTPLSEPLRSQAKPSLRSMAMMLAAGTSIPGRRWIGRSQPASRRRIRFWA